ncbi:AraC family transcriptional regulator [Rhizobium sp. BK251]|uniref:helix-turn-helix domain-containing protein n=1 Tax=Rhizobium sp. BK251 TaxID=2512125 RepID=UPI00104DFA00|nr:AraC family transcriptional regulator [Rhizobium sp. BK251]TCL64130.1 AraC family transcriptional regulator [Rhizobium sp. BK251]
MGHSGEKGRSLPPVVEKHDEAQSSDNPPPSVDRRRWPREPEIPVENLVAAPVLEPLVFSTRDLDPADQFAAWQAYLAPLLDVRLPDASVEDAGFPADHTAWNLGDMLVVQQCTPAHSYTRSAAKIRSNSIDHWHIALLRTGQSWTEVERQVAKGEPGKVELRSLGHPFRGRTTQSQSISLYLPRELLSDMSATSEIKNNVILSGTYTQLLIDYLDSFEVRLSSLAATDLPQVVQTICNMILTSALSSAEYFGPVDRQGGLTQMERARRYVQRNLGSIDLTPDTLCRELGISRTRLYNLFEPSGGVHHYIQKRRLLSAHAALSNSANHQQVVEIALAVGFTSAAHFSRAFSKEFGYSPREARNVAVPRYFGHAASATLLERARSFENWVKALGR